MRYTKLLNFHNVYQIYTLIKTGLLTFVWVVKKAFFRHLSWAPKKGDLKKGALLKTPLVHARSKGICKKEYPILLRMQTE